MALIIEAQRRTKKQPSYQRPRRTDQKNKGMERSEGIIKKKKRPRTGREVSGQRQPAGYGKRKIGSRT